jgi:hypothetical protein
MRQPLKGALLENIYQIFPSVFEWKDLFTLFKVKVTFTLAPR